MTPPHQPPESPVPGRVSKLARRPHRKSRNGCFNCKRRKVKCDEVKPACSNCIRFGIPCDFAPLPPSNEDPAPKASVGDAVANHGGEPSTTPRRGPGRPRKDWAALAKPLPQTTERTGTSPVSNVTTPASTSTAPELISCSFNVADAELLLHFISHTASSLHDSEEPDSSIGRFWERNVPQIGLSYHFVLHLAYALAGYHLAFEETSSSDRHAQYLAIARHHSETGLAELNRTLPSLDETNCGALYVSAVLVCYCAFAAGPTGSTDLLVCNTDDSAPQRWLPLIHGVRLIRQTVEPATLFTGLMEPLGGSPEREEDHRPMYLVSGFPHVDWIEPIGKLHKWIASHDSPDTIIYLRALSALSEIYESNYGGADGTSIGASHNQFVFGWLYRMHDLFVACLQRKEPQALLILAYYVPLLKTLKRCWFIDGWAQHLLDTIRGLLSPDTLGWLEWPIQITLQQP
ncbi:hypothetical protein B0J13DRAFT_212882 [Dactylonectria estremocensis]|uniref:Zn(2)-C6 fungal-type domain-containing protein n=1 Tax=Dactylonectria estremocensis TaxID=1079267 RepID=A0A9P9JE85_9HYPO|nr:hypothetical protein B0J13DRAFT_212882 [Dactylonectria estremocensis]